MGILKKIFRRKETPVTKPDLSALFEDKTSHDTLLALDDYICQLCNYGANIKILTPAQKTFYLNQTLEREVNNGGFSQFFFNSSGQYSHETLESLREIGAHKTVSLLQKAISLFPEQKVPADETERRDAEEELSASVHETWDQLDQKFFAYEDNLAELNIEFVRQHQDQF